MVKRIGRQIFVITLTLCLALPGVQAWTQQKPSGGQKPKPPASPPGTQLNAALIDAVRNKDPDRAADLLKRGADPNTTIEGVPLLMVATGTFQEDIVALLLAHKADPNAHTPDGLTPLANSILSCSDSPLEMMMLGGVKMTMKTPLSLTLIAHGADLKAKLNDGTGLLTLAASNGNVRAARILLDKGADINEKSKEGLTPILIASLNGEAPMVRFLLANGASPNGVGKQGVTPLLAGVHSGNFVLVQSLLSKGADTSAHMNNGDTPLKLAQKQKMTALVKLLTSAGAKE